MICLIKAFATKPEYPSSTSGTHTVAACHGVTVHIHVCNINKYPLTSLAGFPCGSNQKLFWDTWMWRGGKFFSQSHKHISNAREWSFLQSSVRLSKCNLTLEILPQKVCPTLLTLVFWPTRAKGVCREWGWHLQRDKGMDAGSDSKNLPYLISNPNPRQRHTKKQEGRTRLGTWLCW